MVIMHQKEKTTCEHGMQAMSPWCMLHTKYHISSRLFCLYFLKTNRKNNLHTFKYLNLDKKRTAKLLC